MRCPNCHSVTVNNQGLCPYCGYDIGEYVRTVQDQGMPEKKEKRDKQPTLYAYSRHALTQPEHNFENGYFYYKKAYEEERDKNDRYKRNILIGAGAIILLLHFAELLALVVLYLT